MSSLYENLRNRMAERNHDKRFPLAAAVMERGATAHAEIRQVRESIRADKNLTATGQHAKLIDYLTKTAPALRKHLHAIEMARTDVDRRRAALRPKFDKVDSAILTAVAARIASMKPAEQARLLLPEGMDTDPIVAQAVLELPPMLSNVNSQLRTALEGRLMEQAHGPAIARLDDEAEAWNTAEAALRTAQGLLQEAGEFPSQRAFNLWFQEVAPPDAVVTPGQRREDEAQRVESLLGGMQGLSHESYEKLSNSVMKLRSEQFDRELEALRQLGGQ
jgi:hypothetical protein